MLDEARDSLGAVMPSKPIYKTVKKPDKRLRRDGYETARWVKWSTVCEKEGLDPEVEESVTYVFKTEEPNPGSTIQIKNWLETLGWVPASWKYIREDKGGWTKTRRIPQIKDPQTDLLCESIEVLIKDNPAVEYLRDMSIIKHRIGILDLFLRSCKDGYIVAGVQGLTNTLRFKHRTCVNIPTVRKPFGKEIRSLLVARPGKLLCGSDMASLEDRTKQHFMFNYDPQYVMEMSKEGFDPHLDMAVAAGMITQAQCDMYKNGEGTAEQREVVSAARQAGKTVNYAATYGAGPDAISRGAGISLEAAENLYRADWERNKAINEVAEACDTKKALGVNWLWNPVSKMYLYLKHDRDRFSTLNQSTGAYCFDMWLKEILNRGIKADMVAQFHDEVVLECEPRWATLVENCLVAAVDKVNSNLKLNRELGCDVQFSDNYAGVH